MAEQPTTPAPPRSEHELQTHPSEDQSNGSLDNEKYDEEHPVEAAAESEANAPQPTPPAGPPGGAPPDGGFQAWLQVAGSWSLFFNTWGLLNTFGMQALRCSGPAEKRMLMLVLQAFTRRTMSPGPFSQRLRRISHGSAHCRH